MSGTKTAECTVFRAGTAIHKYAIIIAKEKIGLIYGLADYKPGKRRVIMNLVYRSTRNREETASASEAILKGLTNDGGLFVRILFQSFRFR